MPREWEALSRSGTLALDESAFTLLTELSTVFDRLRRADADDAQSLDDSDWFSRLCPLPDALTQLIDSCARSGSLPVEWRLMKPLLLAQFDTVIKSLEETTARCSEVNGEPFTQFLQRIRVGIIEFDNPPWTLQRMAELLARPRLFYRNTEKFVVAFAKLVNGIRGSQKRVQHVVPSVPAFGSLETGEAGPVAPGIDTVNSGYSTTQDMDLSLSAEPATTLMPLSASSTGPGGEQDQQAECETTDGDRRINVIHKASDTTS